MKKFLCIFMALMSMTGAIAQNYAGIIYVTPTGAGTHSGDSWVNATSSIDTAQILAQANNAVVWVAAGVYYGNTDSTAENAFVMTEGVNVYGGFAGIEPASFDLAIRDFETNETILDGQHLRRVLFQPSYFYNTETTWDGFIIQNGQTTEMGAGVYLQVNGILSRCVVRNNNSTNSGGGIQCRHATISNCKIYKNTARWGGGIMCTNNNKVINCLVANNTAITSGGGMYSYGSDSIINSTLVNNQSLYGGAYYSYHLVNYITSFFNCIIWGNKTGENSYNSIEDDQGLTTCYYSAIEGGYIGEGNLSLLDFEPYLPLFVNPSNTAGANDTTPNVDWHLQEGSICINRGDNASVTECLDLDGSIRIQQNTVDMGCYESPFQTTALPPNIYEGIVYVTPEGYGSKTGEDWSNACASISDAQAIALMNNADVWVAAGTYYGDSIDDGAFMMKGVNVYGGFVGNEPADYDLSMRDFDINTTILDGDHMRRVLYQPVRFDSATVWDGFTIQNGYTSGHGGGVFTRSFGQLSNCVITNNTSSSQGGGVLINTNSTIYNCKLHNNTANYGGGAYAWYNSNIYNCELSNNTAYGNAGKGGGVYARMYSNIVNSTIVKNNATLGGGVYSEGSDNSLINSIIWGNECNDGSPNDNIANVITSYYTAIEGGYEGEHNIDISNMQLFVNPSLTAGSDDDTPDVNWHLLPNSVCIDNGLNDSVTSNVDLDGLPRINCGTVDMGCYEYYHTHEFYDTANNSFVWHNTTYTTGGDYYWIDSTMSGCDTIHILHLTITVGIEDHNLGASMTVYPNPTTGMVNVQCTMNNTQAEKVEFQLFDAFGRLLRTTDGVGANNDSPLRTDGHGSSAQTQIDLSHYAAGVYFIKAVADEKIVAVRKVMKR